MLKKTRVKHPNKVGKVGPKVKGNRKIQITGQYFTPEQVKGLGGKDKLTAKIHAYGNELKASLIMI